MRRSLLFIPANTPNMMDNAFIFNADSIIFDLEDSVINKSEAKNLLKEYLNNLKEKPAEIIIRINDYDINDLTFLPKNVDTIMLPKATIESTTALSNYILKNNLGYKIIPIIEQAVSLIEANEIAKIKLVDGILLGAEDLATDLNVLRTKESLEIFYARSLIVIAAKANKIDAIDTPYTNINDLEGLKVDTMFAKSLGFNAKACIHPNQVDVVNRALMPTTEELHFAKRVIEAAKTNKGAFRLDNKMIDKPIIERAKNLVENAKKWGIL